MKPTLYLFDFDGTLTHVDTLFDFLKHSFPKKYKSVYFQFIFLFILAKLKIKDSGQVKQRFLAAFLKGKSKSEIEELAIQYFQKRKNQILRKSAIDFIKKIDENADVYLVSASLDIWLQPFADYFGAKLICTKAKFTEQGIFTGKFEGKNCNYEEKKNRIISEINLKSYKEILAYGDSKGDAEMFSLATQVFFRKFN